MGATGVQATDVFACMFKPGKFKQCVKDASYPLDSSSPASPPSADAHKEMSPPPEQDVVSLSLDEQKAAKNHGILSRFAEWIFGDGLVKQNAVDPIENRPAP